MRIPFTRLSQGLRTFASQSAARAAAQGRPHHVPVHHEPSQRILSKAAAMHERTASQFPMVVRDVTSYTALAAVTTGVAWLIYCSVSNISCSSSSHRSPRIFQTPRAVAQQKRLLRSLNKANRRHILSGVSLFNCCSGGLTVLSGGLKRMRGVLLY